MRHRLHGWGPHVLALGGLLVGGVATPVSASSHSDAPLIKQDPQANLTDVYAFVGRRYDDPGEQMLNVLVQVRPFSEPGDGPVFDRFADDALYSIHIANPATGETVLRYNFRFSAVAPAAGPGLKNPDTILSYGVGTERGPITSVADARQNYAQTYEVQRQEKKRPMTLATELLTAPPNVGVRTTPLYNDVTTGRAVSGAPSLASLDSYTRQTIYDLPDGEAVFAGPREDGFYADTAGIADLLDGRVLAGLGQNGGGPDGFKGYNVLAYGIQIPLASLPSFAYTAALTGPANGVGIYASVSRGTRRLKKDGTQVSRKLGVQVNRVGNPLFNELFVAVKDKDRFNHESPAADSQFATYAANPELAGLLLFAGGPSIPATGRTDLVAIFIPDVLRVDTTTGPVRLPGAAAFNRLGRFGGDTVGTHSSGWPNGRRPGDDVVDILLTALASGPTYTVTTFVGDNVAANDQLYNQVFPYLGTPHAGPTNRKDP
jgi:hypothetical protein